MRWKSISPHHWRRSPHLIGGRWCWINHWDHPWLTGRATCQCQRRLTSAHLLSVVKKMPTTFLVMTDPKELFLLNNISSALLPELGRPAELDWSLCFLSHSVIFPNFHVFSLSSSLSMLCLFPQYPCPCYCGAVTVTVHCCGGSPAMVASYSFGSTKNKFRSRLLVLYIVLS